MHGANGSLKKYRQNCRESDIRQETKSMGERIPVLFVLSVEVFVILIRKTDVYALFDTDCIITYIN